MIMFSVYIIHNYDKKKPFPSFIRTPEVDRCVCGRACCTDSDSDDAILNNKPRQNWSPAPITNTREIRYD